MAPTPRHVRASVPLHEPAQLAVVADTHARPHPAMMTHLRALAPSAILHAGDVGSTQVIDQLTEIAPVWVVRGNIDERLDWPDTLTLNVRGDHLELRIFLVHIALAGPRLRADVVRAALAERASLVVCGHSHVPFLGREKGVSVFNPGSIGPRRFALPIVFGVISITAQGATCEHRDAATGQRWMPRA